MRRMNAKQAASAILLLLGLALIGVAIFATALGFDQSPGWGRQRIAVLAIGLAVICCAALFYRYVNKVWAWLRAADAWLAQAAAGRLARGLAAWWARLSPNQREGLLGAAFLAFFLLVLLPIPLSGSLLGPVDTLFTPAMGNTYINRLQAAISGGFVGGAMYPADVTSYGETSTGLAGVYMLFKGLGAGDMYALYFTQAIMFALTAFAALLFARHYTQRLAPAAALLFSTSNFLWANVDDLYAHFYFLPLLSAHCLKTAIQRRSARWLAAAGILGGLQVYSSGQTYIYQTMLLGVILLVNLREAWRALSWAGGALFAAGYLLIPLPRVLFYLHTINTLGAVDVWPVSAQARCFSLQLSGLISSLPGKWITYSFVHKYEAIWPWSTWCETRQLAFLGLGIPLLALLGLRRFGQHAGELLLIGGLGLLFALGPAVWLDDRVVPSPVLLFYKYFPLAKYLRIALRSYTLTVLSVSVLAALGLERLQDQLQRHGRRLPAAAAALCLAFVLAENISWPLNRDETVPWPETPAGYVEFFRDKPEALILDLPSVSGSWPGYMDEIRYLIWQTKHKRNILGGVFGYYPLTRIEAQHYADLLPSEEAFQYFQNLGVTHFVWHDSPHLYSHEPGSFITGGQKSGSGVNGPARDFSWLQNSDYLELVFSNDVLTIYELRVPELAFDRETR